MKRRSFFLIALTLANAGGCSPDNDASSAQLQSVVATPTATPVQVDGPRDAPNSPPFQLSSLDEPCGDQTAAAILSHLRTEYHPTVRSLHDYIDLPPEVPLTIAIVYANGSLTCYPAQIPPPDSTLPVISERIGIVTRMEFSTAGGEFQEVFDTELTGRSEASRTSVDFSQGLHLEELQGIYRPDLPGYEEQFVGLSGSLRDDGTGGSILQGGQRPGYVSEVGFVAGWNGT